MAQADLGKTIQYAEAYDFLDDKPENVIKPRSIAQENATKPI